MLVLSISLASLSSAYHVGHDHSIAARGNNADEFDVTLYQDQGKKKGATKIIRLDGIDKCADVTPDYGMGGILVSTERPIV